MRDLSQFGDGWLLVDVLLSIQVTELATIETNSEICPKHSLPFLVKYQSKNSR